MKKLKLIWYFLCATQPTILIIVTTVWANSYYFCSPGTYGLPISSMEYNKSFWHASVQLLSPGLLTTVRTNIKNVWKTLDNMYQKYVFYEMSFSIKLWLKIRNKNVLLIWDDNVNCWNYIYRCNIQSWCSS